MNISSIPCDIDDVVYYIENGKIKKLVVEGIVLDRHSGYVTCRITVSYKRILFSEFGVTAFLSRESAQSALSEYISNSGGEPCGKM